MNPSTEPLRSPYREPQPNTSEEALEPREIVEALWRPHRAADLILAEYARVRAALGHERCVRLLVALLVLSSVLFAVPYAVVLDPTRAHRIAALYLGAVGLCFPSLHVFTSYLGCRMSVTQNLVMALLISAVAALFSLGFAPIVWFVAVTTQSEEVVPITSFVLLAASLLAGLGQLGRVLWLDGARAQSDRYRATVLAWQGLLVFVAYRLATVLDLA